jgi:hypothetical protein
MNSVMPTNTRAALYQMWAALKPVCDRYCDQTVTAAAPTRYSNDRAARMVRILARIAEGGIDRSMSDVWSTMSTAQLWAVVLSLCGTTSSAANRTANRPMNKPKRPRRRYGHRSEREHERESGHENQGQERQDKERDRD